MEPEGAVERMEIGAKLKGARISAKLTQEQAAQALGVSRQTISNWENEKTYPDIISVVKMSDLYQISLDHLLKEEHTMGNYLYYLEESTNTVRSNKKKGNIILIAAYLVIWATAILVFWFFTEGSDAMGYSLMFLWILLPAATFFFSAAMGRNRCWGRWSWLAPIPFGILYMLGEYATFSAANMAAFSKINPPHWEMIPIGGAISAAGLAIGWAVSLMGRGKKEG